MCEELIRKIKTIIKKIIPEVIKFSQQGVPLEKLSWDNNWLCQKR